MRSELESRIPELIGDLDQHGIGLVENIQSEGHVVLDNLRSNFDEIRGRIDDDGQRWIGEFNSVGGNLSERQIRLREAIEDITQSIASEVPTVGNLLAGLADRINPYD